MLRSRPESRGSFALLGDIFWLDPFRNLGESTAEYLRAGGGGKGVGFGYGVPISDSEGFGYGDHGFPDGSGYGEGNAF